VFSSTRIQIPILSLYNPFDRVEIAKITITPLLYVELFEVPHLFSPHSMSVVLVHPLEQSRVSAAYLIDKCTLFNDALLSPYKLKSVAPIEVFREFIAAVENRTLKITSSNFAGLSLLCAGTDRCPGGAGAFAFGTPRGRTNPCALA
jgi:hypothetical protein